MVKRRKRSFAEVIASMPNVGRDSDFERVEEKNNSDNDPTQWEIERLWAEEVEDRITAYEQGSLRAVTGKEVFRRLRPRKKR